MQSIFNALATPSNELDLGAVAKLQINSLVEGTGTSRCVHTLLMTLSTPGTGNRTATSEAMSRTVVRNAWRLATCSSNRKLIVVAVEHNAGDFMRLHFVKFLIFTRRFLQSSTNIRLLFSSNQEHSTQNCRKKNRLEIEKRKTILCSLIDALSCELITAENLSNLINVISESSRSFSLSFI